MLHKEIEWLTKLFTSIEGEIKKDVLPAAIGITNGLKKLTDFDQADLAGQLIAGITGKNFEDKLRTILPDLIAKELLAQQFLTLTDPNEIIAAAAQTLSQLTGNARVLFLVNFSALVAQSLSDGKLTLQEAMHLVQYVYENEPS